MGPRQNYCVLKNCNRSGIDDKSISYHGFPKLTEERNAWEEFIRRSDLQNSSRTKLKDRSRLCSRHFIMEAFEYSGRNRTVRNGCVPTIFVDFQGNCISGTTLQNISNDQQPMELDEEQPMELTDQIVPTGFREHEMSSDSYQAEISRYIGIIKAKNLILASKSKEIKLLKRKLKRAISSRTRIEQNAKNSKVLRKTKQTQTQTDEPESVSLPKIVQEIVARCQNGSRMEYSTSLKEFALQASFYSPKAYNFLRDVFSKSLPHPRSFTLWTSSIDTKPGLFNASLVFLKKRSESSEHKLFYGLSLDEMSIRKQIVFDGKMMKGCTDYEIFFAAPTNQKEASNALFIMASEVNGNCRIPIGYILSNGCDSELMASVIRKSLEAITDCGSKTLTITFDGLPVNLAAAELMGANLDVTSDKLKTYISHPGPNDKVYFFPDPCHMMKLVRNTLEAYECFIDKDKNEIKWKYFKNLVDLQTSEGLRAGNKLTRRHSNFANQKMKVRLAVQLLSSSVSIAMKVCEKIGVEEFAGCSATADFALLFDRIFDALNSRPNGKGYKSPLGTWNRDIWRKLFKDSINYMRQLRRKSDNRLLLKTKRKTCIIGFIICLTSLTSIMEDVVLPGRTSLRYLPTYKLSQDILELFFSTLRQRFGRNNNPNIMQLESALRRILAIRIKPNLTGNCLPQEDVTLPRISPLGATTPLDDTSTIPVTEFNEELELPDFDSMSLFVSNVVVYIAGFVGRRVAEKLDCDVCVYGLIQSDTDTIKLRADCVLLSEKNNGGLFVPSDSLIKTCKATELVIREYHIQGVKGLRKFQIVDTTLKKLLQTEIFQDLRIEKSTYHSTFSNHVLGLMKMIVEFYVTVRLHYIAKQETLSLTPTSIRSHLTKTVLFSGQ